MTFGKDVRPEAVVPIIVLAAPESTHGLEVKGEQMSAFRVRFLGRSALQVNTSRTFAGPGHRVRVKDALRTPAGGEEIHDGLLFTVDIDAEDATKAVPLALGEANRVADQLALAHSCAIENPRPLFCLSLETGELGLALTQFIRDVPELRQFRRPFSKAAMDPVFGLIDAAGATGKGNLLPRIDRALHYLRRSYNERDPIDRFEDLNNGLQAIEPRLREQFGASTTYHRQCERCREQLNCANCGNPATAPDNHSGADHLVTAVLGRPVGDARALRRKRIAIVHATEGFSEILDDLGSLTELATQTLIAGVMELVKADPALRDDLMQHHLPIFDAPQLVIGVILRGASREVIEQQRSYPAVRLKSLEVLRPSRQTAPTEPDDVLAVQISVDVENWEGEWEPTESTLTLPRDPVDSAPPPQILIRKAS